MLLEVLGGVSAHQQQHYVLATSCLPELAQDLAFAGVTSSKNVAAALGGEQQLLKRVAQTGWVRWQGRLCSSQLAKCRLESPGSASFLMCDIPSVMP